jgi:hypothetical protein
MTTQPARSGGERLWRGALYALSAVMAASALVDFDAGRVAKGLGALGAAVLMLSLMVQFPFLHAVLKASRAEQSASPERVRKQREDLLQQADRMRAAHPWAEVASRAGWTLLAISLVLRVTGLA